MKPNQERETNMQLRDLIHAHTLPDLERRYNAAKPWRNPDHPEGSRPAGKNRKKYVSIRPITSADGDFHGYACRYHNTDVVSWLMRVNPDRTDLPAGQVTIHAWPSISTNTFAEAFSPANLRFDFAHDDGYFVIVSLPDAQGLIEQRVYEFNHRQMRFVPDTTNVNFFVPIEEETKPYQFIDTHSPLIRAALTATQYPNFSKWLNAVASFDKLPYTHAFRETDNARKRVVVEADDYIATHGCLTTLANPDTWMHLWAYSGCIHKANPSSVVARREAILQYLREAIYAKNSLPPRHDTPWVTLEQHTSQRQARKKYA